MIDSPIIAKNWAYYNDMDTGAAAWTRELIKAGLVAPGEVDERSILDVSADDVRGFVQCHWFCGIAGWSYALRLAGWPDDRPVWTGSPPCQPFSAAGKQKGRNDERHLAPHFVDLVGACRPAVLFGEQVASAEVFGKAAKGPGGNACPPPQWAWLDDLSDRLEAARYAVGAVDFPSAGVGAPHIRQRTYFGAVSLADASGQRVHPLGCREDGSPEEGMCSSNGKRQRLRPDAGPGRAAGGMADADAQRHEEQVLLVRQRPYELQEGPFPNIGAVSCRGSIAGPTNATNGFWGSADWLLCRDERWRPVEPGTFPLAHGVSGRVGLLRGYGNAINPHAAAQFIEAFSEAAGLRHLRLTTVSEMTTDVEDIFG